MYLSRNPVCNNRSRFLLLTHKSRFVDFQKVRIQEVQAELPRGCIPRSLEVILRAESVESAQAGERSVKGGWKWGLFLATACFFIRIFPDLVWDYREA